MQTSRLSQPRFWFRRAWLIILAVVIAVGAAYAVMRKQPTNYRASATILIGDITQLPNPDPSDISAPVELSRTYSVIARTVPVLTGARATLNEELNEEELTTVEELRSVVSTRSIIETPLFVVSVTYHNPRKAALLANAIAEQLILESPSTLTTQQEALARFTQGEIDRLTEQLRRTIEELETVEEDLRNTSSDSEYDRLNGIRNSLIDRSNQFTASISQYSDTLAGLMQRTGSLEIVERAEDPTNPTGIGTGLIIAIAAIMGFGASMAIIVIFEYFNHTIKNADEAIHVLGIPLLASIARFGGKNTKPSDKLIALKDPDSSMAEAYRTLTTNMLLTSDRKKGIYIITSPSEGEGKSTTAANLAVTLAADGRRVLLIDADMRQPGLHKYFDMENKQGLSTFLDAETADEESTQAILHLVEQNSKVIPGTGMRVMATGPALKAPAQMLGSESLKRRLTTLINSSEIDIVIFDTPPCLAVSDSAVLAANVGASVILVIGANTTAQSAAVRAKEQFMHIKCDVRGAVLNKVNPADIDYGYGYGRFAFSAPIQYPQESVIKEVRPTPSVEPDAYNLGTTPKS